MRINNNNITGPQKLSEVSRCGDVVGLVVLHRVLSLVLRELSYSHDITRQSHLAQ